MIRIYIILQHIKEDALEIQEFVQGLTLESFAGNKMVRKAVRPSPDEVTQSGRRSLIFSKEGICDNS